MFTQVCNVSVKLEEKVINAVLESAPAAPQGPGPNESLVKVPSEVEIKAALKMMKNGRAPGADGISVEW